MTQRPVESRTNDTWLADLRSETTRGAALADLRALLASGLRQGLVGWVDTGAQDFEALAEDFAQEALLKVLAHLDTFRGESQFTTWAHKIAVRVALTELRRQRWKDASLEGMVDAQGGSEESIGMTLADTGGGPEAAVERMDLLGMLQRTMMEALTERQFRAVMAVNVQGMPMGEVARRMGMERNALYKLLHDARLRLTRRLARDGLSPEDFLRAFS